jgi:hypothetical protein
MLDGQVHLIIYPAHKNARGLNFIGEFPIGRDKIVGERTEIFK